MMFTWTFKREISSLYISSWYFDLKMIFVSVDFDFRWIDCHSTANDEFLLGQCLHVLVDVLVPLNGQCVHIDSHAS